MDGLQARQQLQCAKAAQGAAALKLGDVQGHVGAWKGGLKVWAVDSGHMHSNCGLNMH